MNLTAAQHFSCIQLTSPMPEVAVGILAYLHNNPDHELLEPVETECHGRPGGIGAPRIPCPTAERFTIKKLFVGTAACDACREMAKEEAALIAHREQWAELCPKLFRETDLKHPDFPKAQWETTKDYDGKSSLLLLGPTRSGKTRLAFILLKRCLHFHGKNIGVMWDENLQDTKSGFKSREELIEKWGRFDVLLIDDGLLSGGRDDKITSFLKSLLDYIHRHGRHVIITSQLTGDDYVEEMKKFDGGKTKSTEADAARVAAVLSRIREMCGAPIIFHGAASTPAPPPSQAGKQLDIADSDRPF